MKNFINLLFRKRVSRDLQFKVKDAFRIYFEGVMDYDFDSPFYLIRYKIQPRVNISINDLGIKDLKVFRYRGNLTLEITTSNVEQLNTFITGYKEYISKSVEEDITIEIKKTRSLFNY